MRRLLLPAAFLLVLLTYGTLGYVVIDSYSVLDALFMTVITIATVGYSIPHPLGAGGEIFTISLIVLGVIGFLYTFGLLVELLSSNHWQEYRRVRRMERTIAGLDRHIIICGYGRTGQQVVSGLRDAGEHYVIIEKEAHPLEQLIADGEPHVIGDAASDEVLRAAGIGRARGLVSAVDSDERAVYITLSARSLNPEVLIVARASYPDSEPKLTRAGADRVVSPYRLSGRRMASLVMRPAVVDAIDIVMTQTASPSSPIRVEELRVTRPGDVALLASADAMLLALRSQAGVVTVGPTAGAQLAPGDLVIAMGTPKQLADLADLVTGPTTES